MHSLALHRSDVMTAPPDEGSVLEGVGVVARRGVAKLFRGRDEVAVLLFDRIDVVDANRHWRISGPDGAWLVRRTSGCQACHAAAVWPVSVASTP